MNWKPCGHERSEVEVFEHVENDITTGGAGAGGSGFTPLILQFGQLHFLSYIK